MNRSRFASAACGNYLQGGIWSRWPDELIGAEIVPGMRDQLRA